MKEKGNHVLSIYMNGQEKLKDAFQYFKEGLLKKESVLLITDEISKSEAIEIMVKEYEGIFDVHALVKKGRITVLSRYEWYFINNTLEGERTKRKWMLGVSDALSELTSINSSTKVEIKRLRIFVDTKTSFTKDKPVDISGSNGYGLARYEELLEKEFFFPLDVICAYEAEDVTKFDRKQLKALIEHHGIIHASNYNALLNPPLNAHIILLYENQQEMDESVSTYINEGLKRGQLCVYASVFLLDKCHIENFASRIINYDKNIKEGNLIVVNLANYYIDAMIDNLQQFEKLKELTHNAKVDTKRKDKHIRFVGDCASFLFKNKHFNECINLEKWWHKKPFEGSVVCPYPKDLLNQFPYDYYQFKLFDNHNLIIDTDSNLLTKYMQDLDQVSDILLSYKINHEPADHNMSESFNSKATEKDSQQEKHNR